MEDGGGVGEGVAGKLGGRGGGGEVCAAEGEGGGGLVEGVVASARRVDAGAQDVGGARTHVGEQQVQQQAENDEKGKGKAVEGDGMAAKEEQQVPNSAPAAMQSFSDMNDLFGDYEMGHLSGWGI